MSEADDLKRWKRAVIHIEAVGDTRSIDETINAMGTGQDPSSALRGMRDYRTRGTAVFLVDATGHHWLVTARHVVTDRYAADLATPSALPEQLRQEMIDDWIFPLLIRVPSLDEVIADPESVGRVPRHLMNLGAGGPDLGPYSYTDIETDLCVISLEGDPRTTDFRDELLECGYEPVEMSLLDDGPSDEGAAVFSVGYPSASVVGEVRLPAALNLWRSASISLPLASFGRVAMLNPHLPTFVCDISIYPGNSGGPIVESGRLVGIVSRQPAIPLETNGEQPGGQVRIPFAIVVKGEHLRALIEEQRGKDALRQQVLRPDS